MHDLAVGERVERVGGVVGHEPRGVELGERVGERERDALVLEDRPAEGLALLRPRGRLVEQALGGAAAARRDEQALDEDPLPRPGVSAGHAVGIGHATVAKHELGVVVEVRVVEEAWRPRDLEAGRAGVDEEQHLLSLVHGARR